MISKAHKDKKFEKTSHIAVPERFMPRQYERLKDKGSFVSLDEV